MTLPITIPIGVVAARGQQHATREARFVAPASCVLGRLHVERAPRPTLDQRGVLAVLSDLEIEIFDATEADRLAGLIERRDRLLEQVVDQTWTATRDVAIEEITVDDTPLEIRNPSVVLSEPNLAGRVVLPLASAGLIPPGRDAQIVARPQMAAFRPERFLISSAGTPNGAADWYVTDIRIGNRSQLAQASEIPGEMFGTNAIDAYISFETVQPSMDVTIVVRYVGPNPDGAPFYASMVGTIADGWSGLPIETGQRVILRVRNEGEEGELRAVWLAVPSTPAHVVGDDDDEGVDFFID